MEVKAEATRVDDVVITVQIEGRVSEFKKLLQAEPKDVPWPLQKAIRTLIEEKLDSRFREKVKQENSP